MVEPKLRFPEFNRTWEISKIDDFVNEMRGGASLRPKEILNSGDYKIIPKKSIQSGGKIVIDDNCSYVTSDVFKRFEKNQVDKTYLLVVLRDLVPTGPNIGYIVENDKVENGILAQGVYGFKLSKGLNEQYLIQFSNTPKYRTIMRNIMVGSTQVHIRNSSFLDVKIPYTSLPEQQKIAEFLSTIDTVIEKQKETVSVWEERKKGVMQKLFSQEVRFKANDGSDFPEWEEKKIRDITLSHNAGVYIAKDNYGTGTNIIGVGDIYESDVINGKQYRLAPVDSDEYILDEGDLVYGESSLVPEGIARTVCVGVAGKGTAFAWHTRRYKVDRTIINPYFLTLQVNYAERVRNHLMRVCTRNALTGMTTNEYFGTKVSVPCLAEQQKIADCLSSLDEVIEKQKATLAAWEELKKGLLQQMFV